MKTKDDRGAACHTDFVGVPNAQKAPNAETVETGQINGAAFRIEVPARGNKGLVMYCHGYEFTELRRPIGMIRRRSPGRDVPFARLCLRQSAYSTKGWR